ncbi:MAG: NrfD/PsrC family molybdoenzyme membrane anchor subunit, partial [Dehalococcoidia bacterium]
DALPLLWWLGALGAVGAAGYTGFLFGQAEGRDLWQSPLFLWHLLASAIALGAAALTIIGAIGDAGATSLASVARVLAVAAIVTGLLSLAEVVSRHATADAARAAHELGFGRFAVWFWAGAILCGAILPLVAALLYLGAGAPVAVLVAGSLFCLAGIAAFEWAWVLAGQVVPLS